MRCDGDFIYILAFLGKLAHIAYSGLLHIDATFCFIFCVSLKEEHLWRSDIGTIMTQCFVLSSVFYQIEECFADTIKPQNLLFYHLQKKKQSECFCFIIFVLSKKESMGMLCRCNKADHKHFFAICVGENFHLQCHFDVIQIFGHICIAFNYFLQIRQISILK